MLKILNSNELKLVSGGETCPAEHIGQSFNRAEFWRSSEGGEMSFVKCFYGRYEKNQKPGVAFNYAAVINLGTTYWPFTESAQLYDIYWCTRKYTDCSFMIKK